MLRPIIIDVTDLWQKTNRSLLKVTAVAGASTIEVYNTSDFAINLILQIGEFGEEGTEIIKTHASTAPVVATGVVTLASTLKKSHAKDVAVYIVPYDQIEISHAATLVAAKTVLSLADINPNNDQIRYDDTTASSGYYFTRYKETITNTFSGYSDPIPYTGYELNTVGYLIYGVLDDLGKEMGEEISYDFLIRKINSGLSHIKGKLKRWSNCQEFNYKVDQIKRGEDKIALPSTYYDKNSNKSCLAVRIGSGAPLIYKDKKEFTKTLQDSDKTAVATEAAIGDITLVVDNSYDFPSSGTLDVFVNNTKYSITYTANTKSTGTFSGIPASGDGSITATLAVDSNVWYNINEQTPSFFSIWDGYLYIGGPVDSTNSNQNIYMDFYTDIVRVDSDSDVLSNARYDLLTDWLRWEVRNKTENGGVRDYKDGDFLLFSRNLDEAVRRESSGQKFKMRPKVSGINYNTKRDLDFDRS